MLRKLIQFSLILAIALTGIASARLLNFGGGGAIQSITGVTITSASFTGGAPAGTVVGTLSAILLPTSPPFTGTLTLGGSSGSDFVIVGNDLQTTAVLPPGNYPINITATQSNLFGSPFVQPILIVGNAPTQTISAVALSNSSFAGGSASGTVVGVITTTMAPASPAFSGALSLSGTNASDFQIVGTNLETNGILSSGTYNLNIVATQVGAIGSPFTQPVTITGTGQSINSVQLSNNNFASGSPSGTLVGVITVPLSPSTPAFSGSLSLTGANAASFQIVGPNLETSGSICPTPPVVYSINVVATQGGLGGSPFTQPFTVTCNAAGVVDTASVINNSSSASPGSVTPIMQGVFFPPAAVPAGQHAVPSIAGTPVTNWQLDSSSLAWSDSSFRGGGASMFVPNAIPAMSRASVTWTLTAGPWPSIVPATMATTVAESDFNVLVTNLTTAYINVNASGNPNGYMAGFTVPSGSGSVSEMHTRDNPIAGAGCGSGCTTTFSIQGCSVAPTYMLPSSGTPAWPTTPTLLTAGSGCPTIGSGTWMFDVNAISAGVSSIPLCTDQTSAGNAQICQYSGGAVKDGFEVWGYYIDQSNAAWAQSTPYTSGTIVNSNGNSYSETVASCTSASSGIGPTGIKNITGDGTCSWNIQFGPLRATADIERWKNSGGTTYKYNAIIETDSANYVPLALTKSYNYNADFRDGTTVIRGSSLGDLTMTGIQTWASLGSWYTADANGLPFWVDVSGSTADSLALNNVVPSLTTADKVFFHAAQAISPIRNLTPTTAITIPVGNTTNWEKMENDACSYIPYQFGCIDQGGIGTAGNHSWDSLITAGNSWHYENEDTAPDGGWSWLRGSRIAGLGGAAYVQAPREELTNNPVNWIPTAAWSPAKPGKFTDPDRPIANIYPRGNGGLDMGYPTGGSSALSQSSMVTDNYWDGQHYGNWMVYPYVVEGRRYELKELSYFAQTATMNVFPQEFRSVTISGHTYYAEATGNSSRFNAWMRHAIGPCAAFNGLEADGAFCFQMAKQNYDMLQAWYPFTGTFTMGTNPAAGKRAFDMTTNGALAEPLFYVSANPPTVIGNNSQLAWFILMYNVLEIEDDEMRLQGLIPSLDAVANIAVGAQVNNLANPCPYLLAPYTIPYEVNTTTQQYLNGGSPSLSPWDASTLSEFGRPTMYPRAGNLLQYYAGDSVFQSSFTSNFTNTGSASLVSEGWFTTPTVAASGTSLTVVSNKPSIASPTAGLSIAVGSNVTDLSVASAVPLHTYVTALTGTTGITTSQSTTVPAPVTTTASSTVSSGFQVTVASAAGIEIGDQARDITTPGAIFTSVGEADYNVTVGAIAGNVITLNKTSGNWNGFAACPTKCVNAGDTLQFNHILAFSLSIGYPDNAGGVAATWPAGSYVFFMNINNSSEATPNDHQVGTFPPPTSPAIVEGQALLWTPSGSSGTQGTLTTLSDATPPNTLVVPTVTGQSGGGFIPNASCPAPNIGTIGNGNSDYQNNHSRLAEGYAVANMAAALGINSTAAATALSHLAPFQTPIGPVYNQGNYAKWLNDNHF